MKRLLTFFLIIRLAATAQDSTSISFSTETMDEFRKQSLMDEYERAFGGDRKVNTRLRVGLLDSPHSKYNPVLPFIHLEQRIGSKLSIGLGGVLSTREDHFYRVGELNGHGFNELKVSLFTEIRYYFEGNRSLSGNYTGLEFKQFRRTESLKYGLLSPYISRIYYLNNQYTLNVGKQFGSLLDVGLQAGFKDIFKPELDESGFVIWGGMLKKSFTPFVGLYSKISLGVDVPFNKGRQNEACEFVNCFTEFSHLFKVNLSNLFYIDPYIQNLKIDVAYEQKLWNLPLSVSIDLITRVNNERNYHPTGMKAVRSGNELLLPTYENQRKNQTLFDLNSTLQMRYYFLQKRAIAKGKAVENLSGVYGGLFYTQFMKADDPLKFIRLSFNWEPAPDYPKFTTGLVLGLQKKILKNYYYDFSIKYNATYRDSPVYTRFNQDIKFGYAF
jgi:hypothetical protein